MALSSNVVSTTPPLPIHIQDHILPPVPLRTRTRTRTRILRPLPQPQSHHGDSGEVQSSRTRTPRWVDVRTIRLSSISCGRFRRPGMWSWGRLILGISHADLSFFISISRIVLLSYLLERMRRQRLSEREQRRSGVKRQYKLDRRRRGRRLRLDGRVHGVLSLVPAPPETLTSGYRRGGERARQ